MMARLRAMRTGDTDIEPFRGRETSQDDFAVYLGTNRKTYGEWERSAKAPPISALIMFAERFNISLDFIMRGIGPARPDSLFPPQPAADMALADSDAQARYEAPKKRRRRTA